MEHSVNTAHVLQFCHLIYSFTFIFLKDKLSLKNITDTTKLKKKNRT